MGSERAVSEADELSLFAKAHAFALGFDLVGIAALGPMDTSDAFDAWIGAEEQPDDITLVLARQL